MPRRASPTSRRWDTQRGQGRPGSGWATFESSGDRQVHRGGTRACWVCVMHSAIPLAHHVRCLVEAGSNAAPGHTEPIAVGVGERPGDVAAVSWAAREAALRRSPQVQIDFTPIDVMVLAADGVPVRADLTIAVDVATRTICAAVLRPVGTEAVDASLLLAKMLVPEPMRPGWADALRMSYSRLPFASLLTIDARMREAAAKPVIVPEQVVIDHGKVFMSETFIRAPADSSESPSSPPARTHPRTRGWSGGHSTRSKPCSHRTSPGSRAPTPSCADARSRPNGIWTSSRNCWTSG